MTVLSVLRVTWVDASTNEDGFHIYRNGQVVADVGANGTVWEGDTSMFQCGDIFAVSAYNSGGESPRSAGRSPC